MSLSSFQFFLLLAIGLISILGCSESPDEPFAIKYQRLLENQEIHKGDVIVDDVDIFIGRNSLSFQNISNTHPDDPYNRELAIVKFKLPREIKGKALEQLSQGKQKARFKFQVTAVHSTPYENYIAHWFEANIIEIIF